ncbi:MAG: hypothetical protein LBU21_05495, partial [Treponema sp.]|nr:hypothetical protein [Treponema sp.]
LSAQYFKPFTSLRMLKTAYFEIIFPPESEATARTLAAFADSVYERISGTLDIKPDRPIPVTISPHTDEFNGYMNPLPYPHILLFDTPMSPEMTGFTDSLESLFVHELTHAISLSSRSGTFNTLRKIFGGWVYPTGITAPQFMVEGISVSFESLDGTGRAKDPLIKQKLLQAIWEDAFLTPFQAAGAYDFPPNRSAYYDYGGYFSAWLQKKYGMEKYAELWKRMGGEYPFSFSFYKNGFFGIFSNLYGIPFLTAWDDFKESLRIWTIEENTGGTVYNGALWGAAAKKPAADPSVPPWDRGGGAMIQGVSSGGGRVFVLDRASRRVIAYEPATGKTRTVTRVSDAAYDLASSADGSRLLVSSYGYTGDMARTMVTEYDAARGGKIGRARRGLYNGRYFRDGLIGIVSDRHINNIAFVSPSGEEEILLRGSSRLLYSSLAPLNDRWIAFIAAREGRRELCLYDYETRQAYTLAPDSEDGAERWRHIRGLRASGGSLLFSYNHDGRMFKLGMVDIPDPEEALQAAPEAFFAERDLSGGVFLPVLVDDAVYYRGAFTTWDALMRYPEARGSLSGTRIRLRLVHRPEDWSGALPGVPAASASPEPPELSPPALSPLAPPEMESKRYLGIGYFNPFRLWLPMPLIRLTGTGIGLSLDGGGILSYMTEPTDLNQVFLSAAFDARSLMGVFDLRWINLNLGFPLTLSFTDDIDRTTVTPSRRTGASVSASLYHSPGGRDFSFSVSTGFGINVSAFAPDSAPSAYTWPYGSPDYVLSLGLGVSNLRRFHWESFGRGIALNLYGRYLPRQNKPRFEGVFGAAAASILPLRLSLYGVWDPNGMTLQGTSGQYASTPFSGVASVEYMDTKLIRPEWLVGGEQEFRLFSAEIQRSLSHLYYNRVFGTLAYRGLLYDDGGTPDAEGNRLGERYRIAQSLILRLGIT